MALCAYAKAHDVAPGVAFRELVEKFGGDVDRVKAADVECLEFYGGKGELPGTRGRAAHAAVLSRPGDIRVPG